MKPRIGFIGLGLIGGSLAKAFKKFQLVDYLVAFDQSKENLELAHTELTIDDYVIEDSQLELYFKDLDYIFLCCPVQINVHYYQKLIAFTTERTTITDVGSTKTDIAIEVMNFNAKSHFIGGHPMTGSEKSGFSAANAHLFENAYYLLTPTPITDFTQEEHLVNLLKGIGAIPMLISPDDHDFTTAAISHVPHIVASALVNTVSALDKEENYMHTLAAGGFKDITRIASSSPVMWQQISLVNKEMILMVMEYLTAQLNGMKHSLLNNNEADVYHFFDQARKYRNSFHERPLGPFIKTYSITVDIIDEPGIIAKIATLLSEHEISLKNIGIINNREDAPGVLEILFYDQASQRQSYDILSERYTVYIS